MIFLPCIAMETEIPGKVLGLKLEKAGVHEIDGLLDRAMYSADFKTMKKESPKQVELIKAYAMQVIAKAILKKSDDMLKNDALKSSAAGPTSSSIESDFIDISFDTAVQPIQQGMSLLDLDAVESTLFDFN